MVLTTRVFAVSGMNRPITLWLVFMSTVQLALGCYHVGLVATTPAKPMRPVPGLELQFCVISRHRSVEVANTVLSIPFDVLVFVLTIIFARRLGATRWSLSAANPSLLHILARDGFIYFLFILTCHIVYTFTLLLGRSYVQVIPAIGMYVYIPIAISRLMLSLRKAAIDGEGWVFYSRSRNQFVREATVHLTTEDQAVVGTSGIEAIHLKEMCN